MIKKETFKIKMEEARDLLGSTMKISAFQVMYDRCYTFYNNSDFEQAIDQIVENGDKLIYPVLKKAMDKARERRVDMELRNKKAQQAKEAAKYERTRGDISSVKSIIEDLQKRIEYPELADGLKIVKYNSVLVHENGRREECFIDFGQKGFDDALTVVHELVDGHMMRRCVLNTTGLKIVTREMERDQDEYYKQKDRFEHNDNDFVREAQA